MSKSKSPVSSSQKMDVQALVNAYAQATATASVRVAGKSSPVTTDGAAIMALGPQEQTVAVVLLMREIAKVRRHLHGQNFTWWNYVACREPYAGLTLLLHALLRRRLPYAEPALVEMVRHTADLRENSSYARGEPTAKVVKAAADHTKAHGASSSLKAELKRLSGMLQDIAEDREVAQAISGML